MLPNDPKLSHGHRIVTGKCNGDNQISYYRRNSKAVGSGAVLGHWPEACKLGFGAKGLAEFGAKSEVMAEIVNEGTP